MPTEQYVTEQPTDHWRNQRENLKIPRDNNNESTMVPTLSDEAKAVLRKKLTAIIKKQEKSQIKNLSLHLKKLEKEGQRKCKVRGRKQIIKILAKIEE